MTNAMICVDGQYVMIQHILLILPSQSNKGCNIVMLNGRAVFTYQTAEDVYELILNANR